MGARWACMIDSTSFNLSDSRLESRPSNLLCGSTKKTRLQLVTRTSIRPSPHKEGDGTTDRLRDQDSVDAPQDLFSKP